MIESGEKTYTNSIGTVNIGILNDYCLLEIFSYLIFVERIRIERVSKRWQQIAKQSWTHINSLDILTNQHPIGSELTSIPFSGELSKVDKTFHIYEKQGMKSGIALVTSRRIVIKKILSLCGRNIKFLVIDDLQDCFNNKIFNIISKYCRNIESISVRKIPGTSARGFSKLLKKNKNIEKLGVYHCPDEISRCLRLLTTKCLKNFEVKHSGYSTEVNHEFNSVIGRARSLEQLCLVDSGNESTLKSIDGNLNLKKITLEIFDLEGSELHGNILNLTKLVNLEYLQLAHIRKHITDDFLLEIAKSCRKLKFLGLSGCHNVTAKGLTAVFSLPNLTGLNLIDIKAVDDNILSEIPINIKTLSLRSCARVTDRGVTPLLWRLINLEFICLNSTAITKRTIAAAIESTAKRNNNIILHISMKIPSGSKKYFQLTPLLKIL